MLKQQLESSGGTVPNELDRILQLVDTAITSLLRVITDLRPSILDPLGLGAALDWQIQEFQQKTGIVCSFSMGETEYEIDDDRATAIVRIFQEALTNIAKHARAFRLDGTGTANENELMINIQDNGIGITKERHLNSRSFGICGMQERARIFSGCVRITGSKPKGTTVSIRFPLRREAD